MAIISFEEAVGQSVQPQPRREISFEEAIGETIPQPTPDEIGLGDELRGVGRAINRSFRRFIQSTDVAALRRPADIERNLADAKLKAEKYPGTPVGAEAQRAVRILEDELAYARATYPEVSKRAAESLAKQQAAIDKLPPTQAEAEFQEKGIPAFWKNPVEIAATALGESSVPMAQAVAGGIIAGPLGASVGAFTGTANAESTARVLHAMQEAKVDLKNPQQVIGWFADRAKSDPALAKADLAALPPAILDSLTGGFAGRILGPALGKGVRRVAAATAGEAAVQAAGGGAGSALSSVVAGEPIDWKDVFLEAVLELAPFEAGANVINERARQQRNRLTPPSGTTRTRLEPEGQPTTTRIDSTTGQAQAVVGGGAIPNENEVTQTGGVPPVIEQPPVVEAKVEAQGGTAPGAGASAATAPAPQGVTPASDTDAQANKMMAGWLVELDNIPARNKKQRRDFIRTIQQTYSNSISDVERMAAFKFVAALRENGLESLINAASASAAKPKPLPAGTIFTVQDATGDPSDPENYAPRQVQVDFVVGGENTRSTNPDTLRAEGYAVPDAVAGLAQGQYVIDEKGVIAPRVKAPAAPAKTPAVTPAEVTRVATVPVAEGVRVNTRYGPGTVSGVLPGGRVHVRFDDGTAFSVAAKDVRVISSAAAPGGSSAVGASTAPAQGAGAAPASSAATSTTASAAAPAVGATAKFNPGDRIVNVGSFGVNRGVVVSLPDGRLGSKWDKYPEVPAQPIPDNTSIILESEYVAPEQGGIAEYSVDDFNKLIENPAHIPQGLRDSGLNLIRSLRSAMAKRGIDPDKAEANGEKESSLIQQITGSLTRLGRKQKAIDKKYKLANPAGRDDAAAQVQRVFDEVAALLSGQTAPVEQPAKAKAATVKESLTVQPEAPRVIDLEKGNTFGPSVNDRLEAYPDDGSRSEKQAWVDRNFITKGARVGGDSNRTETRKTIVLRDADTGKLYEVGVYGSEAKLALALDPKGNPKKLAKHGKGTDLIKFLQKRSTQNVTAPRYVPVATLRYTDERAGVFREISLEELAQRINEFKSVFGAPVLEASGSEQGETLQSLKERDKLVEQDSNPSGFGLTSTEVESLAGQLASAQWSNQGAAEDIISRELSRIRGFVDRIAGHFLKNNLDPTSEWDSIVARIYESVNATREQFKAGAIQDYPAAVRAAIRAAVPTIKSKGGTSVREAESTESDTGVDGETAQGDEVERESRTADTTGSMTVEQVSTVLVGMGIQPGGAVHVVNNPSDKRDGVAIFDTRTGKLSRIVLNAAHLPNAAAVQRVLLHELGHVASETGALAEAIAALSESERIEIFADMQRLGYKSGDKAEFDARGTELLVNSWRNRSWFTKLVASILDIARSIGIPMTRLAAEHAAARAVGQAYEAVRTQVGGTGIGIIQASNARVVAPWFKQAMSLIAYHGTPHKVDRFSTAKIGTGEGAQVYGWGIYLADRLETADSYRSSLSRGTVPSPAYERFPDREASYAKKLSELAVSHPGVIEDFSSLDVVARSVVLSVMRGLLKNREIGRAIIRLVPIDVMHVLTGGKFSSEQLLHNPSVLIELLPIDANDSVPSRIQAVNTLSPYLALAITEHPLVPPDLRLVLSDALSARSTLKGDLHVGSEIPYPREEVNTGNIYTVTLNVEPDELLDWDAPAHESTRAVRLVNKLIRERFGVREDYYQGTIQRAADFYHSLAKYLARKMGRLEDFGYIPTPSESKLASEFLLAAGIKGIRYLDQGSRQGNIFNGFSVYDNQGQEIARYKTRKEAEAALPQLAETWTGLEIRALNIKPTYNYVIFDENDITITHENGQPVRASDLMDAREGEVAMASIAEGGATPPKIPADVERAADVIDALTDPELQAEIAKGLKNLGEQKVKTKDYDAWRWVLGKQEMSPELVAEATQRAKDILLEAGFAESDLERVGFAAGEGGRLVGARWKLTDEAETRGGGTSFPLEQAAQNLVRILERELAGGRANMPRLSMIVSSVRALLDGDQITSITRATKDQLFSLAQGEASLYGLLNGLQSLGARTITVVGRNVRAVLRQVYEQRFGQNGEVAAALRRAFAAFRAALTPAAIRGALNSTAAQELYRLAGDRSIDLYPIVEQAIANPFYSTNEIAARFADLLAERVGGMTDAVKNDVRRAFLAALSEPFKAGVVMSQKEIQDLIKQKKPRGRKEAKSVWKQVEEAVNEGLFDPGKVLERTALGNGFEKITDDAAAVMKKQAQEIQFLRDATPEQLLPLAKTPEQRAAIKAGDWKAFSIQRQVELMKQIEVRFSKLVAPLNIRTNAAAVAQAAQEWTSAVLLLTAGFPPRQFFDVAAQAILHTGTSAVQHAWQMMSVARKNKQPVEPAKELATALSNAFRAQIKSAQQAMVALAATMQGTPRHRQVEDLITRIALFDRAEMDMREHHERARYASSQGDTAGATREYVKAIYKWLVVQVKWGRVFAAASDSISRVGSTYQNLRQQVIKHLRLNGMNRAEAEMRADDVIGDIHAEWKSAILTARALNELGMTNYKPMEEKQAATDIVMGRIYERAATAGMPVGSFREINNYLADVHGWNEREEKGPGAVVAAPMRAANKFAEDFPPIGLIFLGLMRFSNAIHISINRVTTFAGLGFFPQVYGVTQAVIDPKTGEATAGSPWYRTPEQRQQRKVEAALGLSMLGVFAALYAMGIMRPRMRPPKDEREREAWLREHVPYSIEFYTGDGGKMVVPARLGAFSVFLPWMAAIGAWADSVEQIEKEQQKLNEEAAKHGLPPGKARSFGTRDIISIVGEATFAAMLGGRTAGGAIDSLTDYGTPNIIKTASGMVRAYVPGVPAWQEAARWSGVRMDPKKATMTDFLFPLPSSGARAVNMLGDSPMNPDGMKRILPSIGLPFYDSGDGEVDPAYVALAASGYRPPTINSRKAYEINGEWRPFSDDELTRYTVLRGQYLKEQLNQIGAGATEEQAKAAYAEANERALTEVGVNTGRPSRAGRPSSSRASFSPLPSVGSSFTAGSALRPSIYSKLSYARSTALRPMRGGRRSGTTRTRRSRLRSFRRRRSLRLG